MGIVFGFSFDGLVESDLPAVITAGSGVTVSASHAYAGDALLITADGFASKGVNAESPSATGLAHLWIDSLGTGAWSTIGALMYLGVAHAYLAVNAAGRIAVLNGEGGVLAMSPPGVIARRRMFHCEWQVLLDDAAGTAWICVDGVQVASAVDQVTQSGDVSSWDAMEWRSGPGSMWVDNWIIAEDLSGTQLGPKVLDPAYPDADVSATNVVASGVSDIFDALNDPPGSPDGFATGTDIYVARVSLGGFPERDSDEEIFAAIASLWVRRAAPGWVVGAPYLQIITPSNNAAGTQLGGGTPISVDAMMRQAVITANPDGGSISESVLVDFDLTWTND